MAINQRQHEKPPPGAMRRDGRIAASTGQLTPSFFCRLDDDVVYWNTSRLSG
jgi:hypothetical protein